jgi:hypothetical protein
MRNPFAPLPDKSEQKYRENLSKWERMAESPADKAILRSQPREVIELVGPKIEAEWTRKAANSGELFPYVEKMPTGHEAVKYAGDIKAAFSHCTLPAMPFRLSKVVYYQNQPYLATQVPPHVERAMALAKIGDLDWK